MTPGLGKILWEPFFLCCLCLAQEAKHRARSTMKKNNHHLGQKETHRYKKTKHIVINSVINTYHMCLCLNPELLGRFRALLKMFLVCI